MPPADRVRIPNMHEKHCGFWYEEDCDCIHSTDEEAYDELEPPIRKGKRARPKHGIDNRSIFTLWDLARRVKDGK